MRQPDLLFFAEERGRGTLVFLSDEHVERRASISWDPAVVMEDGRDYFYRHDRELLRLRGQVQLVWGEEGQQTQIYRSSDLGQSLLQLEPLPAEHLSIVRTCMDGTLLSLDEWRLRRQWRKPKGEPSSYYVCRPGGQWEARPLPPGFQAEGISCAPNGIIYVAGGQFPNPNPTDRGASEAVLVDEDRRGTTGDPSAVP